MATFDSAHRQELWDALVYELYAIAEYREWLYLHRDDQHTVLGHKLGDVSADGTTAAITYSAAGSFRSSDQRVREVLGVMRPHAFATAFKVHDLIIEWILGPKPGNNPRWRFTEKQNALAQITANQRPAELQHSTRWTTFCEVYVALVEPRNVAMHREGMDIGADGSIDFGLVPPNVKVVSDEMQGAYLRAMAIVGDALAGVRPLDAARTLHLDAALALLSSLPGVTPSRAGKPNWTQLDVEVPQANVLVVAPLSCRVDFDFVARVWREHIARSPDMVVAGIVNIRAQGASFAWRFSHHALPTGIVDLTVGAPEHDRFVVHD